MKKSIFFAFFILVITIGWLISGQISKNKGANDVLVNEKLKNQNISEKTYQNKDTNKFKVESKIFISRKIDQSIIIQGQTIYNKKIDVKSEITGNITSINFNRGDQVLKGTSMIEISQENRVELLNSAKELIKLYEVEYSSAEQLLKKGLSSKSKLGLAAYNLSEAKSKLKNIELDIQNTNIKSPFNGIVTKKNVEVSDYVTPGNILFTIVDLNPIKIRAYLSEFDVNKVKLNTKTIIKNSNGDSKTGVISFISPNAEVSTRTFEIIIKADNDDLLFKSGVTTSIIIKGQKLLSQKISPSILTLLDDGTIGVKALDKDNKVIFFPIKKIKDTTDGMWVSGLPDQVNLIISGQEYVTLGQQIETK